MTILPYARLVLLLTQLHLALGCSTTYHSAGSIGQYITSPNYPGVYNDNECRVWIIIRTSGKYVGITFTDFKLEPRYDFVELRDGPSPSSLSIGKFTGDDLPPARYSASGLLYVKFTSDGSVTKKGFKAKFAVVSHDDFQPIVGHPLACTFDRNLCGWSQSASDDFDWTLTSGHTPSSNTGPSADHTTGSGNYVYIETSSPRSSSDKAKLAYSSFTGSVCFRFYRHMFGSHVHELNIYIDGRRILREAGNKGNRWILDQVQIDGSNINVAIEAVRGNDYAGDIALDDFVVTKKCNPDCCGIPRQISGTTGFVNSPNYPGHYDNDQRCSWRITSPSGKSVRLSFTSFNLAHDSSCSHDFVEVRNGFGDMSPLLGKYCGNSTPPDLQADSGKMQIDFKSDSIGTDNGFIATFTEVNIPGCSGIPLHISGQRGFITSPAYPNTYGRNQRCIWVISVSDGSHVKLSFNSFQLKYHSSCKTSSVVIRDGKNSNSSLLGKYCGNCVPPPQYASSGTMRVTFNSDNGPAFSGFNATYNAVPIPGQPYLLQSSSTNISVAWLWDRQNQAQFLIKVQEANTSSWISAKCLNSLSAIDCLVSNPVVAAVGLKPYHPYRFRIHTKVFGEWNSFYVTSNAFWTLMAGPSEPPPNIQAHSTGPTSIRVLWKPIPADFINGILLGYLVICLQQEIGSDRTVQVVSTDNTSVEFSGLQKNTIYSVKVVGFTVAGNGTISEPVHVNTEVEDPPAISNLSDTTVASWFGHQVWLGCFATGHIPIRYSWRKNGHDVDGKTPKTHESVLSFTPSGAEDFGTYTCIATNRDGTATHNVTLLQIENPVTFTLKGKGISTSKQTNWDWKLALLLVLSALILVLLAIIVVLSRRVRAKQRNVPDQVYDNVSMSNLEIRERRGDIPGNAVGLHYDVVNLRLNDARQSRSRYAGLPAAVNPTYEGRSVEPFAFMTSTASTAVEGRTTSTQDFVQTEQHYQTLQVSTLDNLYEELTIRGRRAGKKMKGFDHELRDNDA